MTVTSAQLATITELDLSDPTPANDDDINVLQSGDFAGLTNLMGLNLSENTLSALPDGIFSNLRNLERLFLNNNQFTELPGGIFGNLGMLRTLDLSDNALEDAARWNIQRSWDAAGSGRVR